MTIKQKAMFTRKLTKDNKHILTMSSGFIINYNTLNDQQTYCDLWRFKEPIAIDRSGEPALPREVRRRRETTDNGAKKLEWRKGDDRLANRFEIVRLTV